MDSGDGQSMLVQEYVGQGLGYSDGGNFVFPDGTPYWPPAGTGSFSGQVTPHFEAQAYGSAVSTHMSTFAAFSPPQHFEAASFPVVAGSATSPWYAQPSLAPISCQPGSLLAVESPACATPPSSLPVVEQPLKSSLIETRLQAADTSPHVQATSDGDEDTQVESSFTVPSTVSLGTAARHQTTNTAAVNNSGNAAPRRRSSRVSKPATKAPKIVNAGQTTSRKPRSRLSVVTEPLDRSTISSTSSSTPTTDHPTQPPCSPSSAPTAAASRTASPRPHTQRERNRAAATKCRARTKAAAARLEEVSRAETKTRVELLAEVARLKEEVLFFRAAVLEHVDCECEVLRRYVKNAAVTIADTGGTWIWGADGSGAEWPHPKGDDQVDIEARVEGSKS